MSQCTPKLEVVRKVGGKRLSNFHSGGIDREFSNMLHLCQRTPKLLLVRSRFSRRDFGNVRDFVEQWFKTSYLLAAKTTKSKRLYVKQLGQFIFEARSKFVVFTEKNIYFESLRRPR